jgi:hypothetical protein
VSLTDYPTIPSWCCFVITAKSLPASVVAIEASAEAPACDLRWRGSLQEYNGGPCSHTGPERVDLGGPNQEFRRSLVSPIVTQW